MVIYIQSFKNANQMDSTEHTLSSPRASARPTLELCDLGHILKKPPFTSDPFVLYVKCTSGTWHSTDMALVRHC